MKITTKAQYGLRILMHVALDTALGRLSQGREIAVRQHINEPYLEQIMVILKKAGLVHTVRGRRGGYQLARDPRTITLLTVIETFEGDLELVERSDAEASDAGSNEARAGELVWQELSALLKQRAAAVNLAQVMETYAELHPEYTI